MRKPISFALAIVAMAAFFGSATSPVIAEQAKPSAPQMVDNMDDDGEVGEAGAEKKASAESAQKGPEAARKIYEDIQAIGKAVSEAANKGNAAIGAIKDPQSEEGRAERAKIIADFNTFRDSEFKKRGELQEKLGKVFAEIEFKDWDLEKDKSLVSNCLYMMGTEAMEKEPAKAMDHLEMILEKVPGERHDATIRTRLLPNLYIQHDNYDAAKAKVENLVKGAGEGDIHALALALGDFEASWGKYDAAQAAYETGMKALPKEVGPRDPLARTKRDLESRVALIGKTAPEIDTETWLGGEAKKLSALKGNVVVLDFWFTWCPPCIGAIPGLNDFYNEHKDKGVMVLGVTSQPSPNRDAGRMPKSMDDLRKGQLGESERGIRGEKYLDHLKRFRDNVKPDYPFVFEEYSIHSDYKVAAFPTMAIVDQEGKVASYIVGGGNDKKIEAIVKRLLANAKKAEDASKGEPKPAENGGKE